MRVQTYSFYTSPLATSTTEKKGVLMPRLSIQLRKNDTSTVPKYDPKTMSLLLHQDLMVEFFAKKVGTRGYPLAYVLRSKSIPSQNPLPLVPNRPYSEAHGSVSSESIDRVPHDYPILKQLSPAQKKELKEHREGQGKKSSTKVPSEKKRFRKGDYAIKKKRFDHNKKRRSNNDDFNKEVKGIISETVSTIIENKSDEEGNKKASISSASVSVGTSLTRNNMLKTITRKGAISNINMRRLFYHMRSRNDDKEDDSTSSGETKGYISISSQSYDDGKSVQQSKEDKLEQMDNEMLPHHRYTHMLGDYMEESISPSVPFLEISSLNTWSNVIRTELDSHANMVVLGQHCRLEDPKTPAPGKPGSRYTLVSAFSPEHKPMRIQVVDASIAYWCRVNETTYILHFNDVLYVPSMEHNLIPPFVF